MAKLSKKVTDRFSFSYNKLLTLGLTDNDLKYVVEVTPNNFRISIRHNKSRKTAFVRGDILDAVKRKWELVKELSSDSNKIDEEKCSNDISIRDGLKLFMEYRKSLIGQVGGIEKTTYEKDILTVESRFINSSSLLDCKVVEFGINQAQEYVNNLRNTHTLDNSQRLLSENTVYNPFSFMRKMFNYFKDELKIIDINPFDKVRNKPNVVSKPKKYLVNEEIKYLLNHLDTEEIRTKLMINIFLESGLRVEELSGLRWSDIDFFRCTFSITKALVKSRVTNEFIFKDLKTKASEREITFSESVKDLLNHYRYFKTKSGLKVNDDDFIFTGYDGELVSPSRYAFIWKEYLNKCGIKDVPLKNTRHSSITFMMQDNPNIKTVQTRSGHSKVTTTVNFYNQTNLYEDRKLVNKFDEAFRNNLGFSLKELYDICYNKYVDTKKLINFIENITGTPIDGTNFEIELVRCQDYLLELFPIFSKIHNMDNNLNDLEIEQLLNEFQNEYKKIKIKPLEKFSMNY